MKLDIVVGFISSLLREEQPILERHSYTCQHSCTRAEILTSEIVNYTFLAYEMYLCDNTCQITKQLLDQLR